VIESRTEESDPKKTKYILLLSVVFITKIVKAHLRFAKMITYSIPLTQESRIISPPCGEDLWVWSSAQVGCRKAQS
jgi:hypothetical protein